MFCLLLNKVFFDLGGIPEVLVFLALSQQLHYLAQQQPLMQTRFKLDSTTNNAALRRCDTATTLISFSQLKSEDSFKAITNSVGCRGGFSHITSFKNKILSIELGRGKHMES